MFQTWKNLFFLHYTVDPEEIASYIPKGYLLDTFDGKSYLGVVGLQIASIRLSWIPWLHYPLFNELNLRTYIQSDSGELLVYFFSLDTPSRLAVALARKVYKLPYFHSRIDYRIEENKAYLKSHLRKKFFCEYGLTFSNETFSAPDHKKAAFFVERYAFITQDSKGNQFRGDLAHTPYILSKAQFFQHDQALIQADFLACPEAQIDPEGSFFSKGMPVRLTRFKKMNRI